MTLPPLHPIFVHFPLTLIPVSIAADWIGFAANHSPARMIGRLSLLVAWFAMLPVIYFGYFDYGRLAENDSVTALVRLHTKLGWLLFIGLTLLSCWRAWLHFKKVSGAGAQRCYLGGAVLIFALTIFQGWYGGELVYGTGVAVYSPAKKLAPHGDTPATIQRAHDAFSRIPFFRDPPNSAPPRVSPDSVGTKK